MACRWCVHWMPDDGDLWAHSAEKGICRRFPQTVPTAWDRQCGEFQANPDVSTDKQSITVGFYNRMHQYYEMYEKERARRIALQKKRRVKTK